MEAFIAETVERLGMTLLRVEKDYKKMATLLEREKVRGIVMGTRRTDPYSS